eukprot:CAMPEP_0198525364 /NCGR_PEP_ID=MMETSP1462-20131121/23312_1 /TAXON_ID=1333877 /ORGANISM="Brandtodinium nutriculum, Strain RCC3387" /LENGTH=276 /DNA_ID=CAMNT_0044255119 /DNA_START=476 /DNA_END=1306 /DNA_ORIENTATION=-
MRGGLRVLQFAFKYVVFVHALGMKTNHFHLSNEPRSAWSGIEIKTMEDSYGKTRVKVADACVRRFGHITINIGRSFFFMEAVWNPARAVQTAFLLSCLVGPWHYYFERSNSLIARVTFHPSRIRDGRFGRFNLMCVQAWQYPGYLVATFVLALCESDNYKRRLFLVAAMQPVTWGDAAGELVGSFFGNIEFPVLGIGEINYKTVEGCAGTLVANLISLAVVFHAHPGHADIFKVPPHVVVAIVAAVGMVAETVAVRSTDNAVILLSCLVALLLMRA